MAKPQIEELRSEALQTIDSATRELIIAAKTVYNTPETGFNEFQTSKFVQQQLQALGYVVETGIARTGMKAKIVITPKKAVLDPQGKTVQTALEHMGYEGVNDVHVGKYLEIELEGDDAEAWKPRIDEACHKLLSNPVIEDYHFTIE